MTRWEPQDWRDVSYWLGMHIKDAKNPPMEEVMKRVDRFLDRHLMDEEYVWTLLKETLSQADF